MYLFKRNLFFSKRTERQYFNLSLHHISPNHRPHSTVGEESPDSIGQPTGE